jgi:hypothetical protein
MENKENVLPNEPHLTYDNLVRESQERGYDFVLNNVQGNNYVGGFNNGKTDFFYVYNTTLSEEDRTSNIEHEKGARQGLKLHISIHPDQIKEGWDIVLNVMQRHGVAEAKIANPMHKDETPDGQEPGKEITIYAFKDPHRKVLDSQKGTKASWEQIIREITSELSAANIRPGSLATSASAHGTSEQAIPGSNYVSWREDNSVFSDLTQQELLTEKVDKVVLDHLTNEERESQFKYLVVDENTFFINRYREYMNAFTQLGKNLQQLDIPQHKRLDEHTHRQLRENNYIQIQSEYENKQEQHLETSLSQQTKIKETSFSKIPPEPPSRINRGQLSNTKEKTPPEPPSQFKKGQLSSTRGFKPTPSNTSNRNEPPPIPPKVNQSQFTYPQNTTRGNLLAPPSRSYTEKHSATPVVNPPKRIPLPGMSRTDLLRDPPKPKPTNKKETSTNKSTTPEQQDEPKLPPDRKPPPPSGGFGGPFRFR